MAHPIRSALAGVIVTAALVVGASGCSGSDESASDPAPTSIEIRPGETLPPVSAPESHSSEEDLASAQELIAPMADSQGWSDVERACVAAGVAGDRDLLERSRGDALEEGSDDERAVAEVGQVCVDGVRFAGPFAESIQAQAGGTLTVEQLACLQDAYVGLSFDDRRALIGSVDPNDTIDRTESGRVSRQILDGCEVSLPG